MTDLIAGGLAGLLLGMAVQRCTLTDRANVIGSIALQKRSVTKGVLWGVGEGTMLTAFLCWLAVIDVDRLVVLPLHGGTVVGGIIFGAIAGLTGLQLGTAPAMIGGGRLLEGLCGTAGCVAGAMALPFIRRISDQVTALLPTSASTLFQVTLDEPFLLAGGFLGQACVGAAMLAVAVALRPEPQPEAVGEAEAQPAAAPSADAETVQEEAVILVLPEEEPVVVDTAQTEEPSPEEPEDEEEPVLQDHPELESPPEPSEDWTEGMNRLVEAAGQGTPVQEEALPVGAKAVGEPERREAGQEADDAPEEDHLG